MSQGLIIMIVIGVTLGYFLIGFVKTLDTDASEAIAKEQKIAGEDQSFHRKNSIGQTILVFENAPVEKKLETWKRSPLHKEFMQFFPNFNQMRLFVGDRIVDPEFQENLTAKINEIENAYFSGTMTKEQAFDALNSF
jgi:hypothetical protein